MRKNLLALVVALFGVACACCAQNPGQVTIGPGNLSGILYASSFAQWSVPQGNAGQYSWNNPAFCRVSAAGFNLNPVFKVGTPIRIVDTGSPGNSETVTPSAVTVGVAGCSITVSPVNQHNTFTLQSGTAGLQEAINFAGALPYQVFVTPDWTRLNGITAMLTAATGNANVTLEDARSACQVAYLWSGSAYVAQPSSCSGGSGGTQVNINAGSTLSQLDMDGMIPLECPDSSGSGTAQVCVTSPTFNPVLPNCVTYYTQTQNSGTGLTVNVNSLGPKSVAIPGASGWTTTLSTSPHSIPTFTPVLMCYDGSKWEIQQNGLAPSTSSGVTQIVAGTNINISPGGGTGVVTINATASGGGSQVPSNANIVFTGTSINDDDGGFLASVFPIATWSRSGSTVTFTNTGTNGFAAGQWINLSAVTGQPFGGGYNPVQISATGLSSTQFEVTASSGPSSCSANCGAVFVPISITAISQSGTTVTFTTQNTNGLHIGDWVNVRYLQSASGGPGTWPATPSPFVIGTGYTLFKVLSSGLTTTQFEVNVGSLTVSTCSSNCGAVESAMNNLPFVTAEENGMPGVANAFMFLPVSPSIVNDAAHYTALFHSISPAVTSVPGYLVISDFGNDIINCANSSTIETAYGSLWSQAHTDGWIVVTTSNVANNLSQSGIGCGTAAWTTVAEVNDWLLIQKKTTLNAGSGEYTDMYVPLHVIYNNPYTGVLQNSQAGGWGLAADPISKAMVTGSSQQPGVEAMVYSGVEGNFNATANGISMRAPGATLAGIIFKDPSGNTIAHLDSFNDALVADNIFCNGAFSTSVDARHCPTGSGVEMEGGRIWLAPSGTPCISGTYILADGTGCAIQVASVQITVGAGSVPVAGSACSGASYTTTTMTNLASTNGLVFTPTFDTTSATGWENGDIFFAAIPGSGSFQWKICTTNSSGETVGSTTWNVSAK